MATSKRKFLKLTGVMQNSDGSYDPICVDPETIITLVDCAEHTTEGGLMSLPKTFPPHTAIEQAGGEGKWAVQQSIEAIAEAAGIELVEVPLEDADVIKMPGAKRAAKPKVKKPVARKAPAKKKRG